MVAIAINACMQVQYGNCYEYNFFVIATVRDTQNYYRNYPFVHVMHTLQYFYVFV